MITVPAQKGKPKPTKKDSLDNPQGLQPTQADLLMALASMQGQNGQPK